MTPRKKLPHHIEWAFEDISDEVAHILRLHEELINVLQDKRGINPLMVATINSKMGGAAAKIQERLGSIERREGPPTNGTAPVELDLGWVNMVHQLIEMDTPVDALKIIIAKKIEDMS